MSASCIERPSQRRCASATRQAWVTNGPHEQSRRTSASPLIPEEVLQRRELPRRATNRHAGQRGQLFWRPPQDPNSRPRSAPTLYRWRVSGIAHGLASFSVLPDAAGTSAIVILYIRLAALRSTSGCAAIWLTSWKARLAPNFSAEAFAVSACLVTVVVRVPWYKELVMAAIGAGKPVCANGRMALTWQGEGQMIERNRLAPDLRSLGGTGLFAVLLHRRDQRLCSRTRRMRVLSGDQLAVADDMRCPVRRL